MHSETVRHLVPVSAASTQPMNTAACECVHHNALTCLAESEHMSRFNAALVFATNYSLNGHCMCPCHLDAQGEQISEQAWRRTGARDKSKKARVQR